MTPNGLTENEKNISWDSPVSPKDAKNSIVVVLCNKKPARMVLAGVYLLIG